MTQGVNEPYRMFTSRAEYRLSLREDNADMRLTEIGYRMGCVSEEQWIAFEKKREKIAREIERMKSTWVHPSMLSVQESERVIGKEIEREYSLADLLKRPDVSYDSLASLTSITGDNWRTENDLDNQVKEQVEIQIKYAGYIERQVREVKRQQYYEDLRLPADINYSEVSALSIEVRQKLDKQRPETLGQASRISGVTPAAISLLLIYLKKQGLISFAEAGE